MRSCPDPDDPRSIDFTPAEARMPTMAFIFGSHTISNSDIPRSIAGNGTYFNRRFLPFIGYQTMFELSDSVARQRFGLAPRPPLPGPDDAEARRIADCYLSPMYRAYERLIDEGVQAGVFRPIDPPIRHGPGRCRRSTPSAPSRARAHPLPR